MYNEFKEQARQSGMLKNIGFKEIEIQHFGKVASSIYFIYDENTKLYEKHRGFFEKPHYDISSIDASEFPLYSHWSYDRIYRYDLIKQPDILMFMLLYSFDFDLGQKKANYDFYEPKTIHESSLSPSIHSVIACELGYEESALDYFKFATRMDLGNYNQNTSEGIHTTSLSAAWINIVYGFGGFRSDGEYFKLAPIIPSIWESYSFSLVLYNIQLKVKVDKNGVVITAQKDLPADILFYDKLLSVKEGENFYELSQKSV
jgi:maltose phosphorylase